MKKLRKWIIEIIVLVGMFFTVNSYVLGELYKVHIWNVFAWIVSGGFILFPGIFYERLETKKLSLCRNGCEQMKIFLVSTIGTVIYTLQGYFGNLSVMSLKEDPKMWIVHTMIAVLVEVVLFWSGIIRIYASSVQIGMKWRLIGIFCGWIPILNLVVLIKLIRIASRETAFEQQRFVRNKEREGKKICKTKYPILMVHGVFF